MSVPSATKNNKGTRKPAPNTEIKVFKLRCSGHWGMGLLCLERRIAIIALRRNISEMTAMDSSHQCRRSVRTRF